MYDVIIVGAGPAGLFASYELAKKNKNLKILLIEKGKFAKKELAQLQKTKKNASIVNPVKSYQVMAEQELFLMVN